MRKYDKYFSLLALIGAIISLLSLFTPAGFYEYVGSEIIRFWIWGFWIFDYIYYNNSLFLVENYLDYWNVGMVTSIIILVSIMLVIFSIFILRKRNIIYRRISYIWIVCGFLILISTIYWMINISFIPFWDVLDDLGIPWGETLEYSNIHFWLYFDIGFGVIGQFLAGFLIIIAGFLNRRYIKMHSLQQIYFNKKFNDSERDGFYEKKKT